MEKEEAITRVAEENIRYCPERTEGKSPERRNIQFKKFYSNKKEEKIIKQKI
jgi:hypothetical protein